MAQGFVLNIDDKLLENLDSADEAIQQIGEHSEQTQKKFNENFSKMASGSLNEFISKLTEAKKAMTDMATSNVRLEGVANISNQAIDAADKIIGLVSTLAKLKEAMDEVNKTKTSFAEMFNMRGVAKDVTKELRKDLKATQSWMDKLKDATDKYEQSIVNLTSNIERAKKVQADFNTEMKKNAKLQVTELASSSGMAKTLNELKAYSKELRSVMDNLDPESEEWLRLNKIYRETNREIKNINNSMKDLNTSHRTLFNTADQLKRAFTLMFSVSAIRGYVTEIAKVRGEFELQQRSLQAILQDKDAADKLWRQTVQLAVRSPFQVKELVTYTKQLAAYRVESDKLYDTTKMLADVSAGLAVDMNRLILAYGQVKAANYLRGTELRQFSEAGINILDELAKHFEELEGTAVSAGEVFERVSKRMVTFQDVEQVFKNITKEGGVFYKMQEIQAETLKGQLSNLRDSIDIMMDSIGRANEGVLKNTVALTRTLVENWQAFGAAIEAIALSIGISGIINLYKGFRLTGDALDLATNSARGMIKAGAKLKTLFIDLGKLILANPILSTVAAISVAVFALYKYGKAVEAANKKYDELSQSEIRRTKTLNQYSQKIEENNNAIRDNVGNQDKQIAAQKANEILLKRIKKEYPQLTEHIKAQTDGIVDMSEALAEQNRQMRINIALQQSAKGNWWQETLEENYKDALESKKNLDNSLLDVQATAISLQAKLEGLASQNFISEQTKNDMFEILDKIGDVKTYNELYSAMKELNKYSSSLSGDEYYKVANAMEDIRSEIEPTRRANAAFVHDLNNLLANLDNQMDIYQMEIEKIGLDPEKGAEKAGKWLDAQLEALGITDEKLKEFAREYIDDKIVKVDLVFGKSNGDKVYTEDDLIESWQKQIWVAIKEVQKANPQIQIGVGIKELATKDKATIINDLREVVPDLQKINDKMVDAGKIAGQIYQTPEQVKQATDAIKPLEKLANLVGIINKESEKGDKEKEKLTTQINLLKKMNKEYEKLREYNEKENAEELIRNYFAESAKNAGLDISEIGFDDRGIAQALDNLLSQVPERLKSVVQNALDNYKVELKFTASKENADSLKKDIDKLFAQYELSVDFGKLGISKDLMKSLFNFDYIDLSGLQSAIKAKENEFIGTELETEYKNYLAKVEELENKANIERTKTYVKYLMEAQREAVKIKVEEMQKIQDVEKSTQFDRQQKDDIIARIKEETKSAMQKSQWVDFKNTQMYTMMFEDLEYYGTEVLETLRDKLETLKSSLSSLPDSDVKEIISQLEKIDQITLERNPFKVLKESRDALKKDKFDSKEAAFVALSQSENEIDTLQNELDIINRVNAAKSSGLNIDSETLYAYEEIVTVAEQMGIAEGNLVETKTDALELEKKNAEEARKTIGVYDTQANARNKALTRTNEILGKVKSATDSSIELMNALGVSTDSVGYAIAESASGMIDLTMQAIQFQIQMETIGYASNTALGVIGWVALGIQAVAKIVSALLKIKDNNLQKQIDVIAASTERAQKKFDALKEAIDNAYNTTKLQEDFKEAEKLTNEMIANYERMIQLEEDKKKTDKDAVKDYEENIEAQKQELEGLKRDVISKATAGIFDDTLSAVRDFVDAWYDAFKETGDGLKGLEDNFEEMFLNLVKQQAAMQIVGHFAKQWERDLSKYINEKDTELTTAEAQEWAEKVKATFGPMNDALKSYLGVIDEIVGSTGELSGLQAGIQGITESQAEIISAYLNSLRFFVADNNSVMKQLRDYVIGTDDTVNPMLAQLRIIAQQTSAMRTLLDSVTQSGHPKGQSGIRVFID